MNNDTEDLITWLRAQLDTDEQVARATLDDNVLADMANGKPPPPWVSRGDSVWDARNIPRVKGTWTREAEHIARWDPARVLAEVNAKRRILDEFSWEGGETRAIIYLAQPYAGQPGWREEWAA